jgi:hypothetical protein
VVHGNSIAYPYGAEGYGSAAGYPDAGLDSFKYLVQVYMARNYLVVGVRYADQRPAYLFIGVSYGFKQGTVGGSFNSLFNKVASHGHFPIFTVILVNLCFNI